MSTIIQSNRSIEEDSIKKSGIIRKPGSKKLYTDFRYNGKRIQKSTGLDDTPQNIIIAQSWMDKQKERITNGAFKFSDAFPDASDAEKDFHAKHEGWLYKPESNNVSFEEYTEQWMEKNFKDFPPGRKKDYKDIIEYRILPFFKDKTFDQINGVVLKDFIRTLNWKEGNKKGQPLSASRARNIMIPFRCIWNDAVEEYQWQRPDPFVFITNHLKKNLKERPKKEDAKVFRFDEWIGVLEKINPYFKPVAEVMIMTGMIGSEIAGLKKSAVKEDRIIINNSILRNHEKTNLKTEYRKRDLPLTKA